jgi:hypothetical protein
MTLRDDGAAVLDSPALRRAIVVGTPLQTATVALGHFGGLMKAYAVGFLFAAMMISATVGYLYALEVAKGYRRGAYGGAIAGALCAAVGIGVSVLFGDMTTNDLILRTSICGLTGAVGGFYGQLAADWN